MRSETDYRPATTMTVTGGPVVDLIEAYVAYEDGITKAQNDLIRELTEAYGPSPDSDERKLLMGPFDDPIGMHAPDLISDALVDPPVGWRRIKGRQGGLTPNRSKPEGKEWDRKLMRATSEWVSKILTPLNIPRIVSVGSHGYGTAVGVVKDHQALEFAWGSRDVENIVKDQIVPKLPEGVTATVVSE